MRVSLSKLARIDSSLFPPSDHRPLPKRPLGDPLAFEFGGVGGTGKMTFPVFRTFSAVTNRLKVYHGLRFCFAFTPRLRTSFFVRFLAP